MPKSCGKFSVVNYNYHNYIFYIMFMYDDGIGDGSRSSLTASPYHCNDAYNYRTNLNIDGMASTEHPSVMFIILLDIMYKDDLRPVRLGLRLMARSPPNIVYMYCEFIPLQ